MRRRRTGEWCAGREGQTCGLPSARQYHPAVSGNRDQMTRDPAPSRAKMPTYIAWDLDQMQRLPTIHAVKYPLTAAGLARHVKFWRGDGIVLLTTGLGLLRGFVRYSRSLLSRCRFLFLFG